MANSESFWRLVGGIFGNIFIALTIFLVWHQVVGFATNKIDTAAGIILFLVTNGSIVAGTALSQVEGLMKKISILTQMICTVIMVLLLAQCATGFKLFPINQTNQMTLCQYAALMVYTCMMGLYGITAILKELGIGWRER